MNFLTAANTPTSDIPERPLRIPALLWWRMVRDLRWRGQHYRESGAFLLGRRGTRGDVVVRHICYDDLDPHALDTGIIVLSSAGFAKLWSVCRSSGLEVLADVHTHGNHHPQQSESDRTHPMIAEPGHLAFILPCFAGTLGWRFKNVAIYEYLGRYRWCDVHQGDRRQRVQFSWW